MGYIKKLEYIGLLIFFILGLYYYVNSSKLLESMENHDNNINKEIENISSESCPNMLIEKDGSYYLFNNKKEIIPNINPREFKSLENYKEYIENNPNNKCPILYLQYTTDTQNNDLILVKPNIFENNAGLMQKEKNILNNEENNDSQDNNDYINENKILDASKDNNSKFNTNMYQGIDTHNQNIGLDTPLDRIYNDNSKISANPMDTNWGGEKYTKSQVDSGKYEDRYVYKKNH